MSLRFNQLMAQKGFFAMEFFAPGLFVCFWKCIILVKLNFSIIYVFNNFI